MFGNWKKQQLDLEHYKAQIEQSKESQRWKLEAIKKTFDFNMRWKDESNKLVIARKMAILEIAKDAHANGADLRLIFALLNDSLVAAGLLTDEIELTKLSIFKDMQTNQIVAVRANEDGLSEGLANSLRPVVLEQQVNSLNSRIQELQEDRGALKNVLGQKDESILTVLTQQTQALEKMATGRNESADIRKMNCPTCKVERTFKNGKCTVCGCLVAHVVHS